MIGKNILHYKIIEKFGSPHEIQAENIIFDESYNVISLGKGSTL